MVGAWMSNVLYPSSTILHAVQSKMQYISAYFTRKQILPFGFAEYHRQTILALLKYMLDLLKNKLSAYITYISIENKWYISSTNLHFHNSCREIQINFFKHHVCL